MKYICIIILIIFSSALSFAQEYIPIDTAIFSCSYLYDFQEDSTDVSSVKSEEMILLIGRHYSVFLGANILYRDSILMAHSNEPFNQNNIKKILTLIEGTFTKRYCKYHIYNNYSTDSIIFTSYLNKEYLKVKESNKINWQIEANKDTIIAGYKCLKASTRLWGRTFIAWFTLDIPINCGPYKFCGLPGLIVKVSDTKNQHCFTLIETKKIKDKQQAIYYKNKQYIEITAEEYVKSLNYYFKDLYNRVSSGGMVMFDDDEKKARSLDKLKSKNNNIEKY